MTSRSTTLENTTPTHLADWREANLPPNVRKLVEAAQQAYQSKLEPNDHPAPAWITAAPGRVNLIGEHTDYSGGFVLPMAINRYTVVYGTGRITQHDDTEEPTSVRLRVWSDHETQGGVAEQTLTAQSTPSESRKWMNYVAGVVAQYLPDLPSAGYRVDLAMAITSDVPYGSGLSSSAAVEVATAVFTECVWQDRAFLSLDTVANRHVERALRCRRAENEWAASPCGVMDQFVVSSASANHFVLIDCRALRGTLIPMKQNEHQPVLLITDSNVKHSIAGGEYGKRRNECETALAAMQKVPLEHVESLRDASLDDVEQARRANHKVDDVCFQRAKHVVSENARVLECQQALTSGDWDRVGQLMNASHTSLRDDFEVSCREVDFLVETARQQPGVYGSRMTGGGFGGCTVTLVEKESVDALMETLKSAYQEKFDKKCDCFVETPSDGARILAVDENVKKQA